MNNFEFERHKTVLACTEVYCMPVYSIYTKGEHVIQNIPCKSNTVPLLTHTCYRQSAFVSAAMSCLEISAYSIAAISTPHVGGWVLLPPHHLISPSCTAPSSFMGWAVKHAAIVGASSPTPSRTALPLPAVFLLTCVLKSMRWSERSAQRARHFTSMLCPCTHIHACMQTVTDLHTL